ncbi:MAG: hypothetical protein D6788_05975, partial [Planctomycetota bacterium]
MPIAGIVLLGPAVASAEWPEHGHDSIISRYRETTRRIVDSVLAGNDAYDKLEELCLTIGHRLSGSKELEQAIDWAIRRLRRDGAENIRREKVVVPHWVRGEEWAEMLQPRRERLHMLGLGGSVGTPPEGITAEVEVVTDEKELEKLGEQAKDKIILFNHVMPPYDASRGSGYGEAVRFRYNAARWAAQYGAVAAVIRSVTARSLRSPHTGAMRYGDAKVKIPAAALSIEDAEMIARLRKRGIPVRIRAEGREQLAAQGVDLVVVPRW